MTRRYVYGPDAHDGYRVRALARDAAILRHHYPSLLEGDTLARLADLWYDYAGAHDALDPFAPLPDAEYDTLVAEVVRADCALDLAVADIVAAQCWGGHRLEVDWPDE